MEKPIRYIIIHRLTEKLSRAFEYNDRKEIARYAYIFCHKVTWTEKEKAYIAEKLPGKFTWEILAAYAEQHQTFLTQSALYQEYILTPRDSSIIPNYSISSATLVDI